MALAAILCFGMFVSASWAALPLSGIQSSEQSPPPAKPGESSASQSEDASPPSQTPSSPASATQSPAASAPAQKSSGQPQPAVPKRRRHRKKLIKTSNCPISPAAPAPQLPGDSPATGENSTVPSPSTTTADCPPAKVVIRNGGTTEPSIQLTGGAGGTQATHQRSTTDQLLGATEDNLKKMAGRQLTASQQAVVNQIHQFMEQSKAAVAAGDTERGHNLALKARLLSDELLKP